MKQIIEKYSEDLSKYISLVHEATEGRYELSGYDLCVIEAALQQLSEIEPKGIQRRRVKGWKMPPNTISVTRPGSWGNPFTGKDAVTKFRECLLNNVMVYAYIENHDEATAVFNRFKWMSENMHLLKGKNLACFCPLDRECHRSVLLEFSNK